MSNFYCNCNENENEKHDMYGKVFFFWQFKHFFKQNFLEIFLHAIGA